MSEKIKISDIPVGKTFEDYPEDTEFVLDEKDSIEDDSFWED